MKFNYKFIQSKAWTKWKWLRIKATKQSLSMYSKSNYRSTIKIRFPNCNLKVKKIKLFSILVTRQMILLSKLIYWVNHLTLVSSSRINEYKNLKLLLRPKLNPNLKTTASQSEVCQLISCHYHKVLAMDNKLQLKQMGLLWRIFRRN